jgi:ubiquinone/menaquinone biosynthesis C-methylase UbiE
VIEIGIKQHPHVSFHLGDAQSLPFSNESFDAIAMNFGILHLPDPEQAVREAYRAARPAARFAFTTWAPRSEAKGMGIVPQAVAPRAS